jgi:hypothetical protein
MLTGEEPEVITVAGFADTKDSETSGEYISQ